MANTGSHCAEPAHTWRTPCFTPEQIIVLPFGLPYKKGKTIHRKHKYVQEINKTN